MKLSIVVPVYNEKKYLPEMLKRLFKVLVGIPRELIIVDDGSTDGTREWVVENFGTSPSRWTGIAERDGVPTPIIRAADDLDPEQSGILVRPLYLERNQGKGAALRNGIRAATGNVIVVQDADIEYDPQDLARMWDLIADGHADVVYGSRFFGRPHRCLYYHHYLANKAISVLFSILYNQILSDLEVCYKMFTREVAEILTLRCNDFGFEIEFSSNVARARTLRIFELGISYYGRTYAEGKKIGWRDGLKAIWYIVRFRFA